MVTTYVMPQVQRPAQPKRSETIFGQLNDSRAGLPPLRQGSFANSAFFGNDLGRDTDFDDSPSGPGIDIKRSTRARDFGLGFSDGIADGPNGQYRRRKFDLSSGGMDDDRDTSIRPDGNRLRITDLDRNKKYGRSIDGELDTPYYRRGNDYDDGNDDASQSDDDDECPSCPPNRPCICPPAPVVKKPSGNCCCPQNRPCTCGLASALNLFRRKPSASVSGAPSRKPSMVSSGCQCPTNRPCTCPFAGIMDRFRKPSAGPTLSGGASPDDKAFSIRPCIDLLRKGLSEANEAVMDHAKETKFGSELLSLHMQLSIHVTKTVLQEVRGVPLIVVHCRNPPTADDLKNCAASHKWQPLGVDNWVAYIKQSILVETFTIFVEFRATAIRQY